jgi:hypothetical protein
MRWRFVYLWRSLLVSTLYFGPEPSTVLVRMLWTTAVQYNGMYRLGAELTMDVYS